MVNNGAQTSSPRILPASHKYNELAELMKRNFIRKAPNRHCNPQTTGTTSEDGLPISTTAGWKLMHQTMMKATIILGWN